METFASVAADGPDAFFFFCHKSGIKRMAWAAWLRPAHLQYTYSMTALHCSLSCAKANRLADHVRLAEGACSW